MSYTCTIERAGLYIKTTRHDTLDAAREAALLAAVMAGATGDARLGARCTMLETGETLRLTGTKITIGQG